MSLTTTTDWNAVKQDVMRMFGIPDQLPEAGIHALRVVVFRRRGDENTCLFEIETDKAPEIGEDLDGYLFVGFSKDFERERCISLRDHNGGTKTMIYKTMFGDLILVKYYLVEQTTAEEVGERFMSALMMFIETFTNREQ